jgi:ATP-dependent helicase/nuclease subunit A
VEDDRDKLLAEVITVLDHSDFTEAFGKNSRAEVEIAGRLGDARVAGRIDRLAVTPDRVLIVDYKTNRPAPEKLADVPPAYITQLAIYGAVLERLYPDRAVAAALLWTDRPSLMEIPAETLKTALP